MRVLTINGCGIIPRKKRTKKKAVIRLLNADDRWPICIDLDKVRNRRVKKNSRLVYFGFLARNNYSSKSANCIAFHGPPEVDRSISGAYRGVYDLSHPSFFPSQKAFFSLQICTDFDGHFSYPMYTKNAVQAKSNASLSRSFSNDI